MINDFIRERLFFVIALLLSLYFIGWIDSGWDRHGDVRIAFSEFVSLKEFN